MVFAATAPPNKAYNIKRKAIAAVPAPVQPRVLMQATPITTYIKYYRIYKNVFIGLDIEDISIFMYSMNNIDIEYDIISIYVNEYSLCHG